MSTSNVVKADKAFTESAAGYELFGQKLEPFSAMRQAAASTMGLRFGLVDEDDIFKVKVETIVKRKRTKQELQFYNQLFSDVVYVTWLCSVPTSRVLRAMRKIEEAKQEAYTWADKNGMAINSAPYMLAAGVFFQIMLAIAASTAKPDVDETDTSDEDEDPNE